MNHGIVDVVAFQEALIIEAVFGIVVLAMLWVGFRRWLQHKEKMGQLIAEQTAERAAQSAAHTELLEARLNAIEQVMRADGDRTAVQIGALETTPLPDSSLKREEV